MIENLQLSKRELQVTPSRFTLWGVEPGYREDVSRLVRLFYPLTQVQWGRMTPGAGLAGALEKKSSDHVTSATSAAARITDEDVSVEVTVQQEEEQNGVLVTAELCAGIVAVQDRIKRSRMQVVAGCDSIQQRKRTKQALLFVLHEVLHVYAGRGQPWGLLMGVRPAKLAHQAFRSGVTDPVLVRDKLKQEYLLEDERAKLLVEIAERERLVMPDLYRLDREVSIYVGIPFCPTHCAYCTFPAYSMVEKARYAQSFLDALLLEVKRAGALLREYGIAVTTVYVGGGTPTSLKAHELRLLLEALRAELPGSARWRELSVEAGRADTITADRVSVMKELGVTRVSVNPQSFRAATLKAIGRGHSPEIVDKRFMLFREAGFTNINMDVILGLPGETLDDVRYTMERTLRLKPDAVTVHTLSFKRSSVVSRERDAYAVAPDEEVRAMMVCADEEVRKAGQLPYYLYRQKDILANLENVGYAMPGKEGLYNISIIEEAQTILALGGGGASKWVVPGRGVIGRHQNPREPSVYVGTLDPVWAKKERALREVFSAINESTSR